jgi:opacity protein-like surface antigen
LNVGYQHAIGLFYTGIEISGEFTPGKVKVQTASTVKSKAHQIANTPVELRYDSEVTSGEPEITLKTKYSFGITPMFGITAGNWIFYVPVHLKMTKYDMKITPANIGTINAPIGVTAKTGYSMLKVTDLKVVADGTSTDTTAAAAAVYKKGKTKFGIEFGLGARVLLSKNVFLGLRYTYAPKTTIKISAPAYTGSKALHDLNRLGTDYKTSIESHNVSLEFGYKF